MFTLDRPVTFSQDIKKSRFIAFAAPVTGEEDAKNFLAVHSEPDANHNCWAWRTGQTYRFSDDGEPSGTAGKLILQAIDGQALDNVAVLVIRWFGGILLGSGGLMRAYGGTAAMCFRAAEKTELIETVGAVIACDFADLALIKARLPGVGATLTAESFTDTGAELIVRIEKAGCGAAVATIADLSRGRATVRLDD